MSKEELFSIMCTYVCNNVLTFEERRSMGVENFHNWVKENYEVVPKSELEIGNTYKGYSKYANKAVWDGNVFTGRIHKYFSFKLLYDIKMNHYEDDGSNVFVPIKEKNNN